MIIDVHGHYTTSPPQLADFRAAQLTRLDDPAAPAAVLAAVGDDELRETVETKQLQILRQRGIDVMLFSPRASGWSTTCPTRRWPPPGPAPATTSSTA